jgi:hypothetical protein
MTRPARPSARDLEAARARVKAVTDWIAAREGSSQPGPAAVNAAVIILATPPHRRDTSLSVHPATVHRVSGHLVAVYHLGERGGEVATAECSCPGEGLCEHLLASLAGQEVWRAGAAGQRREVIGQRPAAREHEKPGTARTGSRETNDG